MTCVRPAFSIIYNGFLAGPLSRPSRARHRRDGVPWAPGAGFIRLAVPPAGAPAAFRLRHGAFHNNLRSITDNKIRIMW